MESLDGNAESVLCVSRGGKRTHGGGDDQAIGRHEQRRRAIAAEVGFLQKAGDH